MEIMGDNNFNVAPKFPQNWGFHPKFPQTGILPLNSPPQTRTSSRKFCIFGRKFSKRTEFSDKLKFKGQGTLLPRHHTDLADKTVVWLQALSTYLSNDDVIQRV